MSDQDFFFDEDEAPAKETAPKKGASSDKAATKGKPASADAEAPAAPAAQSVSMGVAGLIGVIALLAGVIIGVIIPVGGSDVPAPTSTVPTQGTEQSAPQLSPEQLEGGELPEGHPPIGGEGGPGATTETAPAE